MRCNQEAESDAQELQRLAYNNAKKTKLSIEREAFWSEVNREAEPCRKGRNVCSVSGVTERGCVTRALPPNSLFVFQTCRNLW